MVDRFSERAELARPRCWKARTVSGSAWSSATPEVQMAIQDRMKQGGDPARTAATQTQVYQLMGMYSNDRQGFATLDLTPLVSKLPFADFDKLTGMQVAARKLVMRRNTNISYDYGVLDMVFPGGPASASGVSDYDEIAP